MWILAHTSVFGRERTKTWRGHTRKWAVWVGRRDFLRNEDPLMWFLMGNVPSCRMGNRYVVLKTVPAEKKG